MSSTIGNNTFTLMLTLDDPTATTITLSTGGILYHVNTEKQDGAVYATCTTKSLVPSNGKSGFPIGL